MPRIAPWPSVPIQRTPGAIAIDVADRHPGEAGRERDRHQGVARHANQSRPLRAVTNSSPRGSW